MGVVGLARAFDAEVDAMRVRFAGSFGAALVVVSLIFGMLSTFVSALERSRDVEGPATFPLRRYESSCDVLRRELHALSHETTSCALAPECRGSPLLCPRALDDRLTREYERLRDALDAECGLPRTLVDFAWATGETTDGTSGCGITHDGFEAAARGEARPRSYVF